MTTPAQGSGRPPAIHHPLSPRISTHFRAACAGLLAFATVPVWAQDAASVETRTATLPPSVSGIALYQPALLPQRALLFARDVRGLLDASNRLESNQDDASSLETTATDDLKVDSSDEGRAHPLLKRALALLGTPYRWGGTTPESGFDCSGLVGYVFRTALGIELPRISRDMATVGQLIRDRNALSQGDLVFFSRRGNRVDHVGIYLGDGKFVHAPRTGKDVEVANLATGYWSQKFMQARRVADL